VSVEEWGVKNAMERAGAEDGLAFLDVVGWEDLDTSLGEIEVIELVSGPVGRRYR